MPNDAEKTFHEVELEGKYIVYQASFEKKQPW